LAQCVEERTGEILWLCEKHRDGYRSRQTESEAPPSYSPRDSLNHQNNVFVPPKIPIPTNPVETTPKILLPTREVPSNLSKLPLPTSPSFPISPVETLFVPPESDDDSKKSYINDINLSQKLDDDDDKKSYINDIDLSQKLVYVCKILFEVIENAHASGRKHFRNDYIREIAQKMSEHANIFKLLSLNDDQKNKLRKILGNQEYLYIHFLRLIVRYCIGKFIFLKNN
jgi:hypothetical protein